MGLYGRRSGRIGVYVVLYVLLYWGDFYGDEGTEEKLSAGAAEVADEGVV